LTKQFNKGNKMEQRITFTEMSLLIAGHREINQVVFFHQLTESVFYDFLEWSMTDSERYHSLKTPIEWLDEFAEFDCAYEDWLESR